MSLSCNSLGKKEKNLDMSNVARGNKGAIIIGHPE